MQNKILIVVLFSIVIYGVWLSKSEPAQAPLKQVSTQQIETKIIIVKIPEVKEVIKEVPVVIEIIRETVREVPSRKIVYREPEVILPMNKRPCRYCRPLKFMN